MLAPVARALPAARPDQVQSDARREPPVIKPASRWIRVYCMVIIQSVQSADGNARSAQDNPVGNETQLVRAGPSERRAKWNRRSHLVAIFPRAAIASVQTFQCLEIPLKAALVAAANPAERVAQFNAIGQIAFAI